jgi:GT2 family glycosyltransferase
VVDNASSDDSASIAQAAAERHDSVRLLRSPTNRGYAGAVNLALAEARGEYVAVLNMDVVVSPGWLDPLVSFLEAGPQAGVVCPLILLESDPGRINAAGQNIHVTGLGFNRWLDQPRERAGGAPFRVSGLHGAAFLIRRDLLESIGGWDESGFLYHEDVELSWLLRLAGAEIHCVPASTVSHDYHLTMFPHKLFLLERNRWSMLLADTRGLTRLALSPLLALSELMMWSYCLLRGPSFLRAKLDSYRWISQNRERIRKRRRFVDSLRRRSDWGVLRGLQWGYPLDQFLTLGRERGESERNRIGPRGGQRA